MATNSNTPASTQNQATNPNVGTNSTTQNNPGSSGSAARRLALKSALRKSKSMDKRVKFLTGQDQADKLEEEGKFTDLARHLASLPSQIVTHIVEDANTMLDLYQEILDRKTPLSSFGTKLTLSTGEEVEYTPGCLRGYKNPCTGSNRTKDLDEFKTVVREFDELIAKYKKYGTNLLKRIAELEVSHRKALLQSKQIKSLVDLTFNLMVSELAKLKSTQPDATLSNQKEQLAWTIAFEFAIHNFKDRELKLLSLDNIDAYKESFHKARNETGVSLAGAIAANQVNEHELAIKTTVKTALTDLVPKMSFNAWQKRTEDNVLRNINREIAIRYEKRAQTASQEATANAITQGAGVGDNTTVQQLLDKQFKAYTKKFESQLRAKYSADPKSQGSNAGNNGRSTSKQQKGSQKNSSHSPKKKTNPKAQQQQQQKQHKQQKQQQQQKKHKQQQQQQQQKKRKAGQDDQGGAASAGRRKRNRSR